MSDELEILNDDGQLNPAWQAQAEELIGKIATISREYPNAVVMFVLEAALTEQIAMYSPALGDLFTETMRRYRHKATILLAVSDVLRTRMTEIKDAAHLEEILRNELGITPETKLEE